jgi:E3 ubiquitin-protein ligase listerin
VCRSFSKNLAFEIDLSANLGFPLLSAHIYYLSLIHVPSLVRSWWADCKRRQLTIAIDSYTEKHFSPVIIKQQLDNLQREDVRSQLQDDKFSIRISRATNEVTAVVNIDESVTELSLRMPGSFPLKLVEVERAERMGAAMVTDLVWGKLPVETLVNSQVLLTVRMG